MAILKSKFEKELKDLKDVNYSKLTSAYAKQIDKAVKLVNPDLSFESYGDGYGVFYKGLLAIKGNAIRLADSNSVVTGLNKLLTSKNFTSQLIKAKKLNFLDGYKHELGRDFNTFGILLGKSKPFYCGNLDEMLDNISSYSEKFKVVTANYKLICSATDEKYLPFREILITELNKCKIFSAFRGDKLKYVVNLTNKTVDKKFEKKISR